MARTAKTKKVTQEEVPAFGASTPRANSKKRFTVGGVEFHENVMTYGECHDLAAIGNKPLDELNVGLGEFVAKILNNRLVVGAKMSSQEALDLFGGQTPDETVAEILKFVQYVQNTLAPEGIDLDIELPADNGLEPRQEKTA